MPNTVSLSGKELDTQQKKNILYPEHQSINQSMIIFSVAQIVNYYWDHEGVYGETIECEGMICEREMSSAGDGK